MSTLQSFRAARWVRTFNLVLQAILFLTLFLGLNYLALNHTLRYDLTKQRRYSLSPETISWLRNLKAPVRIVVTTTEDNDNPDVRGLLREYAYATETNPLGRITVEYLDVYQRRREADALGLEQANVIMLLSGDKRHVLTVGELYQVGKNAEGKIENQKFIGEQAVTAALLDVSSPTRKKIYFLTGNGELSPTVADPERGLSVLSDQLRIRNFDVEQLDVTANRGIPADADLIIAVAPQNVSAYVQEQLRQYLTNRAGRMLLMLSPAQDHGLGSLMFEDWGIVADDDILCDTDPVNTAENGDTLLRAFLPHPITQSLIANNLSIRAGLVRTVRPVPAGAATGLTVSMLAASAPTAWGERSYRSGGRPQYNQGVDLKGNMTSSQGRLGVIVASERVGTKGNLDFSVPRGRLVVFGMSDLVTNKHIGVAVGNLTLFLNAVNWTVDRDTQLNIPARPIERFQVSLSAQQMVRLRYSLLFVLPGIAALLCLTVYWTRRN